ncbi:unnamed protein product [Cuscuta europaea]|uniref:Uncharacterized protein n=1 Tax=Cuscuta europaea TaxID=41803 RepID=A0A9P0YPH6_CUSEU|nr:unnamed protein product [Cuscuta europaea]
MHMYPKISDTSLMQESFHAFSLAMEMKSLDRSRDVVFHEDLTIEDIEKFTMSRKSNEAAQVLNEAPEQLLRNNDEVHENSSEEEDDEETEESAEQGESQPTLPGRDDGSSSQMVPTVRRSERGHIPSKGTHDLNIIC